MSAYSVYCVIIFSMITTWLPCHSTDLSKQAPNKYTRKNNIPLDKTKAQLKFDRRPAQVRTAINSAFQKNKTNPGMWGYNGDDYYELFVLHKEKIINHLTSINPKKKHIYIIDVGCANGAWGKHTAEILRSRECNEKKRYFYILSLTGGIECAKITTQKNNVTLHQLNQFKIENIDEELLKHGFNLKNNVDLIVSRWTLRHLVDPFGTLARMYTLLTPKTGMLLSNGFLFKFDISKKIQGFPCDAPEVLVNSNAIHLFRSYNVSRDAGQFLIMRPDDHELELPLSYIGVTESVGYNAQCASGNITIYKKSTQLPSLDQNNFQEADTADIYYITDNQQSQNLYNYLKDNALFYIKEKLNSKKHTSS